MQSFLALRVMQNFISQRMGLEKRGHVDSRDAFAELLESVGVVLAGDFNRSPTDTLYRFLSEGQLAEEPLRAAFGRKIPDHAWQHPFPGLQSAYKAALGSEPVLTTPTGCLDYIWFSGSSLLPRSVLQTPTVWQRSTTLSDHAPLMASFSFLDPGPAKAERAFKFENRPAPVVNPVAQAVQNVIKVAAKDEERFAKSRARGGLTVSEFFTRKEAIKINQRTDADDFVKPPPRQTVEPRLPGRTNPLKRK